MKDVKEETPAVEPEKSSAGTVWAVILILLFLGLLGAFLWFKGKESLEFVKERWANFRTGQGAGAFESGDLYGGDANEPLGNDESPVPPQLPLQAPGTKINEETPGTRLKFDD